MATAIRSRLPDRRDALLIVAAAVAVNLIGAVGVPFTATESAWFAGLELPAYYPPNWAFGVVWPILYALLGIAAALVYVRGRDAGGVGDGPGSDRDARTARDARVALGLFAVQLGVNVAWSPIFWGLERADLGLAVLAALPPPRRRDDPRLRPRRPPGRPPAGPLPRVGLFRDRAQLRDLGAELIPSISRTQTPPRADHL